MRGRTVIGCLLMSFSSAHLTFLLDRTRGFEVRLDDIRHALTPLRLLCA
jgi:hypothetical protein